MTELSLRTSLIGLAAAALTTFALVPAPADAAPMVVTSRAALPGDDFYAIPPQELTWPRKFQAARGA